MLIKIERQDDVCILHLSGRFATGADTEYLRAKSDEIRSFTCTKVLVDLCEVPSMGSTAIGFVVGIYSSVMKNPDGRFFMVGAAPRVREVFDLTRLSDVMPSASDVPSGMAHFSSRNIVEIAIPPSLAYLVQHRSRPWGTVNALSLDCCGTLSVAPCRAVAR